MMIFMTLLLLCYSQAMKIHISETTFNCLQNANYRMKQRGSIEIKVTEQFKLATLDASKSMCKIHL